jgi:hypothetical protein
MSATSDHRIASLLGLLGAVLLIVQGILDLLSGVVYLAVGHGARAYGSLDQAVIFVVAGLLVGFFAAIGRMRGEERSLVAGVILIVLALVGWLALGFGSGLLGILAAVLVLIAGVVYLLAGR